MDQEVTNLIKQTSNWEEPLMWLLFILGLTIIYLEGFHAKTVVKKHTHYDDVRKSEYNEGETNNPDWGKPNGEVDDGN